MRQVIRSSYVGVDHSKPCPECKAAPDAWCVNPITGQLRRVPCVYRPRTRLVEPAVLEPPVDAEVVELDFSEPRHPAEVFRDVTKNNQTDKKSGDRWSARDSAGSRIVGRQCAQCTTDLDPANSHSLCAECQLTERNSHP